MMAYFKLKYVLEQGHRPEYLVLPLDYHSFSSYWINGVDYYNDLSPVRHGELRDVIGLNVWVMSMVKKHLPLTSSFNRRQFVWYMVKRVSGVWAGNYSVSRTYVIFPHGQFISLREGFATKGARETRGIGRWAISGENECLDRESGLDGVFPKDSGVMRGPSYSPRRGEISAVGAVCYFAADQPGSCPGRPGL